MKKNLNSTELVKKIKKELKNKHLPVKSQIEDRVIKQKSELQILKQKIEFALTTARDYQDPSYILPKNPVARMIKKSILVLMRVFTKYQIVFNKNTVILLEDIYKYLEILEKKNDKHRSG